jgi:hypothetical protein
MTMFLKLLISFVLGIISAYVYESLAGIVGNNIFSKEALVIYGYKLHHSLYGVLFLVLAYVNRNVFLAGFGLGIITQHTFTDGFRFIQKM